MVDKITEQRLSAAIDLQYRLQKGFAAVSAARQAGHITLAEAGSATHAIIREVLDVQAHAYHAILPDAPLPEEYPS